MTAASSQGYGRCVNPPLAKSLALSGRGERFVQALKAELDWIAANA